MGTVPIYGTKPLKIFFSRPYRPMIVKLAMKHYVLKLYKAYINDDPELTLTYSTTMSNLAKLVYVQYSQRNVYILHAYERGISQVT